MEPSLLATDYIQRGFVGPLRALEPATADELWSRIQGPVRRSGRWGARNRHLDLECVAGLVVHDAIVNAVREVLGPDVRLWRSNVFAIGRTQRMGLRWHQDSYRTLLDAHADQHCSVQLAFTSSTERNCVRVVPGSHRWSDAELRARGYVAVPGCESSPNGTPNWGLPPTTHTVPVLLEPGEFYVFHPLLLHGSLAGTRLTATDAPRARTRRYRLGSWLRALPLLLRPPPERCSIALRYCGPAVEVRPAAYRETPSRAGVVRVS